MEATGEPKTIAMIRIASCGQNTAHIDARKSGLLQLPFEPLNGRRPERVLMKHSDNRSVATLFGIVRAWFVRNVLAVVFVAVLTAGYSTLAIRLHLRVQTAGYDLGIFEQAIRYYALLQPPIVDLKGAGFNLLGDHFHPVLVTLAPFYAVFPTPITLLVAQAFLFALAAAPLVNWARRTLGVPAAVIVGALYGLSFGIASAVGFDFHEIAFAVPLLAFSLSALGQGRLGVAAAWAFPLILVKEDLGLAAVAVIGVLIAWRGAHRLGIITAIVGVAATLLEVTVLLPLVNSTGSYAYWNRLSSGTSVLQVAVTSLDVKALTVILTLGITAFAALYSPLVLVAVPTLVWRFASNNQNYWATDFQYSAVLMPIVMAAMIDTLARWRSRETKRGKWGIRLALVVGSAVTLASIPTHPFSKLFGPQLWQSNSQIAAISAALAKIPDGATVSASDNIVPQLTSRTTVTLFGLARLDSVRPEWILVDPNSTRHYRVSPEQEKRDLINAEADGYSVAMSRDSIILLHDSRR